MTLWDFLSPAGRGATHAARWSSRSATGVRPGGCSPSSDGGSATSSPTPPATTPPTTPGSPRSPPGARCTFDELVAAAGSRTTTSSRPVGGRTTSNGSAAGGSRRSCSSTSSPRSNRPTPLVLVPRRQARHLNSQFDYLGEPAEVMVHPDDAAAAGVVDGQAGGRPQRARASSPASPRSTRRSGAGAVSVPHGHQRRERQPAHRQGRHRSDHRDGASTRGSRSPAPRRLNPGNIKSAGISPALTSAGSQGQASAGKENTLSRSAVRGTTCESLVRCRRPSWSSPP